MVNEEGCNLFRTSAFWNKREILLKGHL